MLKLLLALSFLLLQVCASFIKVGRMGKNPKKWKSYTGRKAIAATPLNEKPTPVSRLIARFEEFAVVFDELQQQSQELYREVYENMLNIHNLKHTTCLNGQDDSDCFKCRQEENRAEYQAQIQTALEMFGEDVELLFDYFDVTVRACHLGLQSDSIYDQNLSSRILPIAKFRFDIVLYMYQVYRNIVAINKK